MIVTDIREAGFVNVFTSAMFEPLNDECFSVLFLIDLQEILFVVLSKTLQPLKCRIDYRMDFETFVITS